MHINGKTAPMSRRAILVMADLLLFNIGVLLGLFARFEGRIPIRYVQQYVGPFGLYQTIITGILFSISGLYRSIIQYSSIEEAQALAKSCGLSLAAFLALIAFSVEGKGFPRSVPFMAAGLSFIFSGGLRVAVRLYLSRQSNPVSRRSVRKRVIVVGAGDAGAMVVRELTGRLRGEYELVGLIDDDNAKRGMRLHGSPVLGGMAELPRLVRDKAVDEVIVAIPSARGSVIRRVFGLTEGTGVKLKTMPGLYEIINGNIKFDKLRDIDVEDLLGREPVNLNVKEIADYVSGKVVLVTGAGGSIGSELCRQVARFQPAKIVMFDHDENFIFELSHELKFGFPSLMAVLVVGDVRDANKVNRVFEQYRPDVVFHAAAHKHVPLMEEHPDEAVQTNIFGTLNCASAACRSRASRFVLISTDKAVNPTSVMGATKAVAEQIVVALNSGWHPLGNDVDETSTTKFMAVRFGNVLGSRGSVVPLFKEQIAHGGPVTVTHPDMRRYFMTIPEAAQLVIQAGALGRGGEVFVLDMGEPIRILDLAETMIRLSGYEPGSDIKIEFTQPRPGEKMFEEVFSDRERFSRTSHPKILVAKENGVVKSLLRESLTSLEWVCLQADGTDGIRRILGEMVPAFSPWRGCEPAKSKDTGGLG